MKLLQSATTPRIMGCFSITQNSFYDGGRYLDRAKAIEHAYRLIEEGADIIDIGAESTRPGSKPVDADTQIAWLDPVVKELRKNSQAAISIDTSDAKVIRHVLDLGVDMINDVAALIHDGAIDAVKEYDCDICLMHMKGTPLNMQASPQYDNVVTDVIEYLGHRIHQCAQAGIDVERICIDPGFGFGKTLEHNCQMLGQLKAFQGLGRPILVGMSRKSMLGEMTGREVNDRLAGSIAVATLALIQGADIVRVHDVKETKDAVKIASTIQPYWQG